MDPNFHLATSHKFFYRDSKRSLRSEKNPVYLPPSLFTCFTSGKRKEKVDDQDSQDDYGLPGVKCMGPGTNSKRHFSKGQCSGRLGANCFISWSVAGFAFAG